MTAFNYAEIILGDEVEGVSYGGNDSYNLWDNELSTGITITEARAAMQWFIVDMNEYDEDFLMSGVFI